MSLAFPVIFFSGGPVQRTIPMKQISIILCSIFSITLVAQSENFIGDYERKYETTAGDIIDYKLSLNPDGAFLFHSLRKLNCAICTEENWYGKGNWTAEKSNLVIFHTDKNKDVDAHHALNLNNTKARFNSKSHRNTSLKIIKTSLKFYSSDIFWVKGKELYKTNE